MRHKKEEGVIKSLPTISPTGSSVLLTLVDYLSGRGKQEGRSKRGKQNYVLNLGTLMFSPFSYITFELLVWLKAPY